MPFPRPIHHSCQRTAPEEALQRNRKGAFCDRGRLASRLTEAPLVRRQRQTTQWCSYSKTRPISIKCSKISLPIPVASGLLRRVSTVDHLLGLRLRIPRGAWMFVLCVLYRKDKRQNQEKEVQIKYRVKKNLDGAWMFVL